MLQKDLIRLAGFWLMLFCGIHAGAQPCNYELRGLVEDAQGDLLVGATIRIADLNIGTASDASGTFAFQNLCAGTYTIIITYLGYADQRLTVRIPAARTQIISLKPTVSVLHDIVIEGDHSQQHSLTQSLTILTEEQLSRTRGKTLGEMLQQIPGVTNLMAGPGVFKPVINGLHSQRILILNNGVRQEGQQWGIDHAPEIDPYIASELEVVKGAETVRYGAEAMGGVILVNPAPLHYSAGIGGEINLALESNNRMGVVSGMIEGGSKQSGFGWRAQGTLKKGGDYHTPDYNLTNTGKEEKNFSVMGGFRKKDLDAEIFVSSFNTGIGILRSAHSGNLSDLQQSVTRKEPWYIRKFSYDINNPRQEAGHHLVKLRLRKDVRERGTLHLTYAGQLNRRKEFDIRRDKRNVPALSLELYTHTLDATFDLSGAKWSGSYGINGVLKENDNLTGIGLLPDYSHYGSGVYAFQKYKTGKWLFEIGGRFDHQRVEARMFDGADLIRPSFSFNLASGSAGSAVFLSQHSRLSSNIGISSRAPLVNELFSQGLHHGAASIEEGLLIRNGSVETGRSAFENEWSWKWINTFQHTGRNVSIDVNAFVNLFSNYIYLTPYDSRLTIRGYFPVFQYRQTDAVMAGGDVAVDVTLSEKWRYAGKASYVWMEDQGSRSHLPFVPPADLENRITFTSGKIGKSEGVMVSVVTNVFLRQTRAPKTIYPEDIPSTTIRGTFDFMPPPSGYTLIGLDVSTYIPAGNRDLMISFTAENLANTSYRNYLNRMRYFADETGRNFSLRITYKFHSHHD